MKDNTPSLGTIIVGTIVVCIVGFVGYSYIFAPYRMNAMKLEGLSDEVDKKDREITSVTSEQSRLALKWNKFSLPNTVEKAAAEYGGMFKPLLGKAGLTVDDFKVTLPAESRTQTTQKKTARHQILTFSVRARGTLASLTKAAESLRQVPVMHRVKQIVVDRADPKDKVGKLNIQMTIEAMIVADTDNHPSYRPSSETREKLKELALSERNFSELPLRDPFLGAVPPPPPPPPPVKPDGPPPEPEPTGPDQREFIRIDTILPNLGEASFFDRSKNQSMRLRAAKGYDTFKITDEDRGRTVVKGKVLRVDARDVYFQVGEDVYAMHIGETLAESMRRPVDPEIVEFLELTALIDPAFAEETKGMGKPAGSSGSSKFSKKGSTKGSTGRTKSK